MKLRSFLLLGALAGAVYAKRREIGRAAKPALVQAVLEGPAGALSYRELAGALREGGDALAHTWSKAPDTEGARELLRHVITLERWSQARLEAVLSGSRPPTDASSAYAPPAVLSIEELRRELQETRNHSAEIADALHEQGVAEHGPVRHNSLGPLTPKGWLRYMLLHGNAESMKLPLRA